MGKRDSDMQKNQQDALVYKSNRKRLEKNFSIKNKRAIKDTILKFLITWK